MDYEKKYKEALEKARQLCAYPTTKPFISDLQDLFPELKESEDEKIRKELIEFVKSRGGFKQEYIAWLEKQKTSEEALQYLRENHSSSEMSDFQATMNVAVAKAYDKGYNDGLEKQGESYTKRDVDDAYLKGVTNAKNEIEKQYEANYQIRKDIATFIFNYKGDIKDRAKWMDYLGIKVSFAEKQGEQIDWRKYIKYEPNSPSIIKENPAWSEEDEKRLQSCLNILQAKGLMGVTDTVNSKWLKSLKDRYTWKPSDEQLKAVKRASGGSRAIAGNDYLIMESLYQDLKKLREE